MKGRPTIDQARAVPIQQRPDPCVVRCGTRKASEGHGDVDDHQRAWVIDDGVPIEHRALVARRQHDISLDHDGEPQARSLLRPSPTLSAFQGR